MANIRPRLACPRSKCRHRRRSGDCKVVVHGYYRTRTGRRRRFLCKTCGRTFCRNTATPYFGLHASRPAFDSVASLSVEGLGLSAIARFMGRSRETIGRWLGRARAAAARFNADHVRGYKLVELQVDELRPALPQPTGATWVFAAIEVSSRLWPATVVTETTLTEKLTAASTKLVTCEETSEKLTDERDLLETTLADEQSRWEEERTELQDSVDELEQARQTCRAGAEKATRD